MMEMSGDEVVLIAFRVPRGRLVAQSSSTKIVLVAVEGRLQFVGGKLSDVINTITSTLTHAYTRSRLTNTCINAYT